MLNPQIVTALQTAIAGLVTRLIDQAGMSPAEVTEAIGIYVSENSATAEQIAANAGTGLVNTDQSVTLAQQAIAEWVGAAPAALDTINEISQALNNDPDIINNLVTSIGEKASIEYVDSKLGDVKLVTGADMNEVAYDALFNTGAKNVNEMLLGKFTGHATAGRLRFEGADVSGTSDPIPSNESLLVEADVGVMGVELNTIATDADGPGLGQTVFGIDHNSGQVTVFINGEITYNDLDPEVVGPVVDKSVPGQLTLGESITAGQTVRIIAYTPKATTGELIKHATVRAYYNGLTFTAHVKGSYGAIAPPVWTCPTVDLDDLIIELTNSFNEQAPAV